MGQIKYIIGSGKNNKRNDSRIRVIGGLQQLCKWPIEETSNLFHGMALVNAVSIVHMTFTGSRLHKTVLDPLLLVGSRDRHKILDDFELTVSFEVTCL